jgi:hypothetical protein
MHFRRLCEQFSGKIETRILGHALQFPAAIDGKAELARMYQGGRL